MIVLPKELNSLKTELIHLSDLPITNKIKKQVAAYTAKSALGRLIQRLYDYQISRKVQAVKRAQLLNIIQEMQSLYNTIEEKLIHIYSNNDNRQKALDLLH